MHSAEGGWGLRETCCVVTVVLHCTLQVLVSEVCAEVCVYAVWHGDWRRANRSSTAQFDDDAAMLELRLRPALLVLLAPRCSAAACPVLGGETHDKNSKKTEKN